MSRHVWLPLAGLFIALALSACKPATTGGTGSTPSQVVVKVGDREISVLQFNHALKTVGILQPGEPIRREVTEKLIDRELAVAQALTEKFDRTPEVLLQIEEARRDVLARAYAESIAATAPQPADSEVARYFANHPELFAERRIFRLREIILPADLPQLTEAKVRFTERQPLAQVAAWLREQGASFNDQMVIRAAEQLPIETLPRLNAATEGQSVFFETPRGVIAYAVLAAQPSPVLWENARPIIRDYLARQSGKRVMEAKVKALRAATTVAYAAAFVPTPVPAVAATSPLAVAPRLP